MDCLIALNPNNFVWDKDDFELDTNKYFTIAEQIIDILIALEANQSAIFMRQELLDDIMGRFPFSESIDYSLLPDLILAFELFLAKSDNFIQYPPYDLHSLTSMPFIINYNLPQSIQLETKYLLTAIYQNPEIIHFLSAKELWQINSDLRIKCKEFVKNVNVLTDDNDIEIFFDICNRRFKESPKHDKVTGWDSRLDIISGIVISLLETAVRRDNGNSIALFNYCIETKEFIVYRPHKEQEYHAYPENASAIPPDVKKKLSSKLPKGKIGKILKSKT